jgi:T5SS/PEP-CTERM-associated repeat protein
VGNLRYYVGVLTLIVQLGSHGFAMGVDTFWTNPSVGSWFDANNWSAGVPTQAQAGGAYIDNAGVSVLDAAVAESYFLRVGDTLAGELRIRNGGTLATSSGFLNSIGGGSNASGTVTVHGVGSRWNADGTLLLGGQGVGNLVIEEAGSALINRVLVGEQPDAIGALTVTGTGSAWAGNTSLGVQGLGTMTVANGAFATGGLTIGEYGHGELNILGGGSVLNGMVDAASFEGSTANISIMGSSSEWNLNDRLRIGVRGAAEISIRDGAALNTSGPIAFAVGVGSSATMTVNGEGSKWTNNHRLILGDLADFSEAGGNAVVTIENGGYVKSRGALIGRGWQSKGIVTVRGVGSVFETGGSLSDFVVGDTGIGQLAVEDGGTLTSTLGFIGIGDRAYGAAIITGSGSSWSNQLELTIGASSQGKLTISNGGIVASGVTNQAAASVIGKSGSANGVVTVEGTGSSWTNGTALRIGFEGEGLLTILDGGAVLNSLGVVGLNPGSSGAVNVNGAGSTWANSSDLVVGERGTAALSITDGGAVANAGGVIGMNDGSKGAASISGSSSTWTNSSNLIIGDGGMATLTVADGGAVSNALGTVGGQAGSSGRVTVSGHSSTWTNSADVIVGHRGSGEVVVSDGGRLSSQIGIVGFLPGSSGIATVVGEGSVWSASSMFVGGAGSGRVSIGTDGVVATQQVFIGSFGTLDITDGGTLKAAAVNNIGFMNNQGTLQGNLNVAGGGVAIGSGAFAGAVTIADGGTFSPGASPGPAFTTDTTWSAGGSYRWEINSLESVGGAEGENPGWDFWNAGELNISGPFTIKLASVGLNDTLAGLEGWNPTHAYKWRIAEATNPAFASLGSLAVNDEDFVNPLAGGSFWLSASNEGRALYLNFMPIPEPSTLTLVASAVGAIAASWRRRRKRHS